MLSFIFSRQHDTLAKCGVWPRGLGRLLWEQEVASSNLATPTKFRHFENSLIVIRKLLKNYCQTNISKRRMMTCMYLLKIMFLIVQVPHLTSFWVIQLAAGKSGKRKAVKH